MRSSTGATPQTLYHVIVAIVPAVARHGSLILIRLNVTKDALCKLDGVLVSTQSYIKTHILGFHNKKQYECREATQDIEYHETTK